MLKLRVNFGEPEHGWIDFSIFDGEKQIVKCDASDIYPSFDELVNALSAMLDAGEERLVTWLEEPAELELQFWRHGEENRIQLEITSFKSRQRPDEKREPNFRFIGTYDEICLPFWRALRNLQGRYSAYELDAGWRWTGHFPTCELALLTEKLGKA